MNEPVKSKTIPAAELASDIGRPKQRSARASAKLLNFTIGYVFSVLSACAIMMWSFFNTWLNVLEYTRAESTDGQNWKIAFVVVFLTSVVPFLLGLVLLFRSLGSTKR